MTKQVRQAITPTHILGSTGTAEGDNLGFRALGSFAGDLGPAWPSGSESAPTYTFSGDTNTGMFRPGANTLAWSTNGSERMRITSGGSVGIGTTSPAQRLDVSGMVRSTPSFGVDGILLPSPESAELTRQINAGFAVASAVGSWTKAGASGGDQWVAFRNGSNNNFIVWDIILENCTQIVCDLRYINSADPASRSISSEFSTDGGTTWSALGSVTAGAGFHSFGGTINFSAPNRLIYLKVRAFYTSGATSSNFIGINRVLFTPTCTSAQWAKVLG